MRITKPACFPPLRFPSRGCPVCAPWFTSVPQNRAHNRHTCRGGDQILLGSEKSVIDGEFSDSIGSKIGSNVIRPSVCSRGNHKPEWHGLESVEAQIITVARLIATRFGSEP